MFAQVYAHMYDQFLPVLQSSCTLRLKTHLFRQWQTPSGAAVGWFLYSFTSIL